MKLVIKDPFTALRVNRALVGLPRYLPSSRMWFEKIEFKGVRWSLKWPGCWRWSQLQEEPPLRRWGWGRRVLSAGSRVRDCPGTRAGGGAAEEEAQRILHIGLEGLVLSLLSLVSGSWLASPLFRPPAGGRSGVGKVAGALQPELPQESCSLGCWSWVPRWPEEDFLVTLSHNTLLLHTLSHLLSLPCSTLRIVTQARHEKEHRRLRHSTHSFHEGQMLGSEKESSRLKVTQQVRSRMGACFHQSPVGSGPQD